MRHGDGCHRGTGRDMGRGMERSLGMGMGEDIHDGMALEWISQGMARQGAWQSMVSEMRAMCTAMVPPESCLLCSGPILINPG